MVVRGVVLLLMGEVPCTDSALGPRAKISERCMLRYQGTGYHTVDFNGFVAA